MSNGTEHRIFSLGSNDPLAQKISKHLNIPLGKLSAKIFSDGEQRVQFEENLRGKNVFLIQSTNPPADNWARLFIAIDAARGASAHEITAVIPYFGYARQERKSKPREPISTRVFATILDALGTTRVLAMDLHNDAIGGFFRNTNVDYLYARPVFISFFHDYFRDALAADDLVVVSPDAGGVVRAQSYAKRLMHDADLAIIHKERDIPNKISTMKLVGDVSSKVALIVDDIADTCGTLARAAALLSDSGATKVFAAVTHGVLSGDAMKTIENSPIEKLFITDTISTDRELSPKIQVVSVANMFGDAIERIESGESLSALFESE